MSFGLQEVPFLLIAKIGINIKWCDGIKEHFTEVIFLGTVGSFFCKRTLKKTKTTKKNVLLEVQQT